jgi:hypothetical protein
LRNLAAETAALCNSRAPLGSLIGACALATLFVSFTGCGGGTPTSPTAASTSSSTPTLISPINGGYVQQNDPATNCRYDPVYGYGFQVTFEWGAVNGATAYQIQLMGPYASVAALDARTTTTRYMHRACGFVAGTEQGWQWKVRAIRPDGSEGTWSAPFYLNFTPCQLSNGLRCAQQPPS